MAEGGFKLHLDAHNHLRAMEEEVRQHPELAHVMDDMNAMWNEQRKKAADDHARAAMIMHEYQVTRRPFALYLRSFETEAYDYLTPEKADEQRWQMTTHLAPSPLEEGLATALEGKLGVIAIANPSDLMMRGRVPKLQLPNEGWRTVLENLVEHAHMIVMDCEELAPGVEFELDTIRRAGKTGSAILVLPNPNAESKASITDAFAQYRGYVVEPRERPRKEHPALSGFPRVAYEDEVVFDQLETSPLFGDLLESAAEKRAAAPAFDPLPYSKALNNEGVLQFQAKSYAEALRLYAEALLIRRATGDREGRVITLQSIAAVYLDTGQPDQALPYLAECREVTRELGQKRHEGLAASYVGFAHELRGETAPAIAAYEEARQLQREHADAQDFADTLTHLANLYRSTSQSDPAAGAYRELAAVQRQRKDFPSEVKTLLELGKLLYEGGKGGQAAQVFVDAVDAAGRAADPLREAIAYGMLGRICAEFGEPSKAAECYSKAVEAAHTAGDAGMIQLLTEKLAQVAASSQG